MPFSPEAYTLGAALFGLAARRRPNSGKDADARERLIRIKLTDMPSTATARLTATVSQPERSQRAERFGQQFQPNRPEDEKYCFRFPPFKGEEGMRPDSKRPSSASRAALPFQLQLFFTIP